MTYPTEFRKKVLEVKAQEKLTIDETAERFNISISSVNRWGKVLEANRTCHRTSKLDMEALRQDVESNPDAYHYERAARFGISESGIRKALKRLRISYKKNAEASESR